MVSRGGKDALFNYDTLNIFLQKSNQALIVELNRPQHSNRINEKMLDELESLFSWATQHLEIHSILITSSTPHFGEGIDTQELKEMAQEKVLNFLGRLQQFVYSLAYLPQTIIADIKNGASGASAELSLGADIRISHHEAKLHFDHLLHGFVPCCGGMGLLVHLVPKAIVRNWILMASPISSSELKQCGLLYHTYDEQEEEKSENHWTSLLQQIKKQGPIQRIQAKRGLLEGPLKDIQQTILWERQIGHAGFLTGDWKEALKAKEENRLPSFTDARNLAKALKGIKEMVQEKFSQSPH